MEGFHATIVIRVPFEFVIIPFLRKIPLKLVHNGNSLHIPVPPRRLWSLSDFLDSMNEKIIEIWD